MRSVLLRTLVLAFAICLPIAAGVVSSGAAERASGGVFAPSLKQSSQYGMLPLSFEPNVGQVDRRVRYLAHGSGYTVYLTDTGVTLSYQTGQPRRALKAPGIRAPGASFAVTPSTARGFSGTDETPGAPVNVQLSPVGGAPHPRIVARDQTPGIVNYLIGKDRTHWHTDIHSYRRVLYRQVYPGVDLVFYGKGSQLEYDWIVRPRVDPRVIVMRERGATSIRMAENGDMLLQTGHGTIRQRVPHIYQTIHGTRVDVAGGYRLLSGDRVGFFTSTYDRTRPLIIDPTLGYSSYFGGGSGSSTNVIANAVSVDPAGNAFITGSVFEGSTIPFVRPYQASNRGSFDAFVAEVNPTGTSLIYATYLGGSGADFGNGIAATADGSAFITGTTSSSNFPQAPAPVVNENSFVVKLNASGISLDYVHVDSTATSTSPSQGLGITMLLSDVWYTGSQPKPSTNFTEMFVRKLDASGRTVGEYELGENTTVGTAIALDGNGNINVVGHTDDPHFPNFNSVTIDPGGGTDAFFIRLDKDLVHPLLPMYSARFGGTGDDEATSVAIDTRDNSILIGGFTNSPSFPLGNLAYQAHPGGGYDGFLVQVSTSVAFGAEVRSGTYLGGTGNDSITGVGLDSDGSAFVVGSTSSSDFPLVGALPGVNPSSGKTHVFVAEIEGDSLTYSIELGGRSDDLSRGAFVDSTGKVYLVGKTASDNFPTTASAFQPLHAGTEIAFIAEISLSLPATATASPTSTRTATTGPAGTPTSTLSPTATLTATSTLPPATTATVPTPTFTPSPTPALTATATSVPAPTSTSVPSPTFTATTAPPRAPHAPTIKVKPGTVNAGGALTITISTVPGAKVTITIQVKQQKKLLYHASATGHANGGGILKKSIRIKFHPAKKTAAQIRVTVETAGGSAAKTVKVTIRPHR